MVMELLMDKTADGVAVYFYFQEKNVPGRFALNYSDSHMKLATYMPRGGVMNNWENSLS